MAVIEVEHLTKRFGKVLAVDDVSFALQPGTITGFLGPNGAGKTTTLRMIVDLVRPTRGTTRVLGGPYHDLARPWTRVGALLDASGFHPGRSGRNALRVVARASGIPDDARRGVSRHGRARPGPPSAPSRATRPACASASPWAASCSATPRCCCSTSPATGSTPRASAGCGPFCADGPQRARPSSSRATSSPRSSRPSTTSSSSARAGCVAQGPIDRARPAAPAPSCAAGRPRRSAWKQLLRRARRRRQPARRGARHPRPERRRGRPARPRQRHRPARAAHRAAEPRRPLPADRRHAEGDVVIDLLTAEILKVRSTRTALGLLIAALLVAIVPTILAVLLIPPGGARRERGRHDRRARRDAGGVARARCSAWSSASSA